MATRLIVAYSLIALMAVPAILIGFLLARRLRARGRAHRRGKKIRRDRLHAARAAASSD